MQSHAHPALADTHCHIDFKAFDSDREAVIQRAWAAGLDRLLIPAIDLASAQMGVELAKNYPGVFAAVGVHPNDANTWDGASYESLTALAAQPKVVAIGEIGLDYYRDRTPPKVQQQVLSQQLKLAQQSGLPVIIHNREASADILAVLGEWQAELVSSGSPLSDRPGVLHSFAGSLETARQAVDMNFFIGITGPVTFKSATELQQIVAELPLEQLLIETDAPFLTPHPHRGQRNEPAYVRLVAEKIASIHNQPFELVAGTTSANARRLFNW